MSTCLRMFTSRVLLLSTTGTLTHGLSKGIRVPLSSDRVATRLLPSQGPPDGRLSGHLSSSRGDFSSFKVRRSFPFLVEHVAL